MTGASSMHGNAASGVTSSQGLNGVKLESQYYCNSYTPPTPVDHGGLLPPSYSKLNQNQIYSNVCLSRGTIFAVCRLIELLFRVSYARNIFSHANELIANFLKKEAVLE